MVNSTNILRDTIFYFKDYLDGQVTDPISSTRPSGQRFILTSYPTLPVRYPVITIKDLNSESIIPSGFQTQDYQHYITIEVRIWADTIAQRDTMADQVYDKLRINQIGGATTSQGNNLHDLKLLSSVNVDEADGPKSKVMTWRFLFVTS